MAENSRGDVDEHEKNSYSAGHGVVTDT